MPQQVLLVALTVFAVGTGAPSANYDRKVQNLRICMGGKKNIFFRSMGLYALR